MYSFADEFKGHCLLEAARQADPAKVKKYLAPDVVNFKHPYTGDTPLVSTFICGIALWSYNIRKNYNERPLKSVCVVGM